jgi:rhodanese-related sulfurtransferase
MAESMEITPLELKQRLDDGDSVYLLDCREPIEFQQARIDGAELIPMRTVPAKLQHIEGKAEGADVVVLCHHGMRSMQVVNWLREQGIATCRSLAGGIDRWSCEVDPTVPRYH